MSSVRCPACGAPATGNFCSQCGAGVGRAAARACPSCRRPVMAGALFCNECGTPLSARQKKPATAHLPWILSAIVLIGFAVTIAILVQGGSGARPEGGTLTGGIGGSSGAEAAGGAGGAMPTGEELANMSPREAADRLFDRAMREAEEEDPERARFFADMALQAYGRVSVSDLDVDAIFHVGLLHLLVGNVAATRGVAEALLAEDPEQLYGLVLETRAADSEDRPEDAAAARERLRAAIEGGVSLDEGIYAPHRSLIEDELSSAS